jgi:hypothetical protein
MRLRSMYVLTLRTWTAGLLLLVSTTAWGQKQEKEIVAPAGQRVFVCGHSFHVMIAAPLSEMAKAAGILDHKLVNTQFIGGSKVIQHWDLDEAKNKAKASLQTGEVDVLTLSPVAVLPDPGIDKFTELALEKNPKTRILVQASWPAFDIKLADRGTFKNEDRDKADLPTINTLYEVFYTMVVLQAKSLNAKYEPTSKRQVVYVVPVGHAVQALRQRVVDGEAPGVTKQSELFRDPIGHANPPVAILAAYCHYAVIYGRSPVGLPTPSLLKGAAYAEHADKLNQVLQEVAWDAVTHHALTGLGEQDHKTGE